MNKVQSGCSNLWQEECDVNKTQSEIIMEHHGEMCQN